MLKTNNEFIKTKSYIGYMVHLYQKLVRNKCFSDIIPKRMKYFIKTLKSFKTTYPKYKLTSNAKIEIKKIHEYFKKYELDSLEIYHDNIFSMKNQDIKSMKEEI